MKPKPKKQSDVCPKCNGAGYYERDLGKLANVHAVDRTKYRLTLCSLCKGCGTVLK
jgi:predicted nucleic-acid-binding Zn-ribbon protein